MTGATYLTYNRLPELAQKLPKAVGRIVWRTANELRTSAMVRMEGPKGGRLYRSHRASAPGEAPAIDTGNLRGSIAAMMVNQTLAIVAVNTEYGIYLEYGTRKMAPRPYIRPAVDEVKGKFLRALQDLEREL